MRLRYAYDWRTPPMECGVQRAVESQIESTIDNRGVIEDVQSGVSNAATLVGRLVEIMNEKGLLTNEEVLRLLTSFEEVK